MTSSIYTKQPNDRDAVYLTPEHFPVKGDGVHDDTAGLQQAINYLKQRDGFGIVFIPEGLYRITDTIYIPKAIRLIGFGAQRPRILLADNAPGYDHPYPEDKGGGKYMLWFTDGIVEAGKPVRDANAGTFYSALSNIDISIGEGNPCAVALRTHYAQHSFISHCRIDTGCGLAGMFDAGNEMEDVHFFGGDYGVLTTKCSPGWPFMVVDCSFEGQRKAAIHTRELGLTAIRIRISNVPKAIDTPDGFMEKLILEDSAFLHISDAAMTIHCENNTLNQWNLRNVVCSDVPQLAHFAESGKEVMGLPGSYRVDRFTHGVVLEDMEDPGHIRTDCLLTPLTALPEPAESDIPTLPPMEQWVNVQEVGAVGDNVTDDTAALQAAIDAYDVLCFPQGWYKVTETLRMREHTVMIGFNPISTQLVLPDNTECFGGMGSAKALLESGRGDNILMGIGIDAGGRNPRAVGCKWVASAKSYMNDVKFIGGHGTMEKGSKRPWIPTYNESRTADADPMRKWDMQYWSLWVTENGGGVFKDIWSASPYAAAGFYASDTSARGRIYAMSVEHHVRNEVKFRNVSNWAVYALQTEEEIAESQQCQPLELENCHDMTFATYYAFRVIWLPNPYPCAVRLWDSENILWLNVHNYTQVKYTLTNTMEDINTGRQVRPWQIARYLQGKQPPHVLPALPENTPVKLFDGFEFADASCADSKGNFYFCDGRYNRIYRIDGEDGHLSLVRDVPLRPLSLYCDTEDNLLVVVEFTHPREATRNGQRIVNVKPADAEGTSYGGWYTPDAVVMVYAMNPDDPEHTMQPLQKIPTAQVGKVVQALHPANRWRDNNDYLVSTVQPTAMTTIAPDGVTVIPDYYDLIRANSLLAALPGKLFCAVDEYYKRIIAYDVQNDGFLANARVLIEHGEYSLVQDRATGRIFVADGDLLMYSEEGQLLQRISMPQRPATMVLGGRDGRTLLVTARSGVYAIKV